MKKFFHGIVALFLFFHLLGLGPPSLRCVDVQANGDVTLTWVPPNDPLSVFDAYLIFSSTSSSGPFSLLDSVKNYNQTTYVHVGAQPQPRFYYLVTRYNSMGIQYSSPSDTLASIKLTVTNLFNGTAFLQWTPLRPTLLPEHSPYQIYVEHPLGFWNSIGNTTGLQYTDTIYVCHDSLTYNIRVIDQSGCISSSTLAGNIFKNLVPPTNPGLDSVSVQHGSNKAILGWHPSPSPDTKGYIIYQFASSAWQPIDTIWGHFNTSYINPLSQANVQAEIYALAALDSCGIVSPISSSHTTMVATLSYDSCLRKAFLNWSPYTAWPSVKYYIYRKINGSEFTLIDSTTNTNYADTLIISPANYCYFIQARNVFFTSSSNEVCQFVHLPELPQIAYLRKASVLLTGQTYLSWYIDPSVPIHACLVYSSSDKQQWKLLTSIPYQTSGQYNWIDPSTQVEQESIYYRIGIEDICGNVPLYSNIVKTMHLNASPAEGLQNSLTWEPYEGWEGIEELILIKTPTHFSDTQHVSLSPSTTTYNDDISMWTSTDGYFTYRLMAVENNNNPLGFKDTVYSNVAFVYQWPRLFVPNAFAPNGINQLFCVYGVFVDNATYSIDIMSRWGDPVYHSDDIQECWDGRLNGKILPLDVYMYKIHLIFPNGTHFEKRGSITLLR